MLGFEKCFIFPRNILSVTSIRRNQPLFNQTFSIGTIVLRKKNEKTKAPLHAK